MSRKSKNKTIPGGGNERWTVPGVCLFLTLIVWLVFGQTVHHQFINFDDGPYIYKNPQVSRGLTLEGIGWAFSHVHAANWHPLTWLSHMVDCQLYGLNPAGHHFGNVLLHAANALLLFLVLRQMTGALWRSAVVAALFAVHPLRVESVAWVAERKDLLSGLFFLLTIGAYLRYARGPWSSVRYGTVLLFLTLGLLSKPMLVTLPLILLLLDYWPLERFVRRDDGAREKFSSPRRLILEKLPLLALAAASSGATLFAQQVALQPLANISLSARIGNALISSIAYIGQMLWPTGLAAYYPLLVGEVVASKIALSAILLGAVSLGVFILRRRGYLVTGWVWYLIMLVPVIGILQVGNQARADRYTYLPQIGLLLAIVWALGDLGARWRRGPLVLGSLSALIIAALALAAHTQASFWFDSETLWKRTLACTRDNVVAELNFGEAVHEKGRIEEAIAHFQKGLQLDPGQASVHSSLGVALLEIGRPNESRSHLETALQIAPNDADAHYNLGNTFLQMGRPSEALTHYRKALEIDPNDTQAQNNMAWILATWPDALIRDGPRAVELAERADSLTRGASPVISATLAAAYAEAGRFAEAVKAAERALKIATAEGNAARAASIRAQLETYRAGAAFRDRRVRP